MTSTWIGLPGGRHLDYVSGHGYGHAVRSAQVIATVIERSPEMPLWVRTMAPRWLFPGAANVESVQLDAGVLQRGSRTCDRRRRSRR